MKFKMLRDQAKGVRRGLRHYWWHRGSQCLWCGRRVNYDSHVDDPLRASKEHLIPRSIGGPSGPMNIVVACRHCNNKRSSKTDWVPHYEGWDAMPDSQRSVLGNMREWSREVRDVSRWESRPEGTK